MIEVRTFIFGLWDFCVHVCLSVKAITQAFPIRFGIKVADRLTDSQGGPALLNDITFTHCTHAQSAKCCNHSCQFSLVVSQGTALLNFYKNSVKDCWRRPKSMF